MPNANGGSTWGASQHLTERVVQTLQRFLHVEAVSGGVLIATAIVALCWANSPAAHSYHALWHVPFAIGIGRFETTQTLHFVINEGLMTIFFLVAGLEIRRELHEGALSNARSAALPVVAAIGGVIAPAVVYLSFNWTANRAGWAVPIATDIAFAVGVLALLGRSIPSGVRILLLALAIIDDIAAVLVIAFAFAHDLDLTGGAIAIFALALVFGFQRLGIRNAFAYVIPGIILWSGLWRLGIHPTLAGVVLGLLTPATSLATGSGKKVQAAHRDLVPPVVSVQTALHGWVAYAIMPLFALANAGVTLGGLDFDRPGAIAISLGIALGLLLGKPLGIVAASALSIRVGLCSLPDDVGWRGLMLIAFLGAIGFTMSIFIAALAFTDETMLANAKVAILLASGAAAALALIFGKLMFRADH